MHHLEAERVKSRTDWEAVPGSCLVFNPEGRQALHCPVMHRHSRVQANASHVSTTSDHQ